MKYKALLFLITLSLIPTLCFGQIKISETIKDSSLASDTNNALYFVDFWATWCGPCIAVSKQLAALQRQYPKNFYIMSLSQENPDIVKRFMKKHNVDLAVAIDYEGETFSKYNISSLPYGVLLNAKGEILWEGHPAEFKSYHIDGYLSTNKKQIAVNNMFKQQEAKPVFIPKEKELKRDFEIEKLNTPVGSLQVLNKPKFLELSGSLQEIMAYTNNVYREQVNITPEVNNYYIMRFKYNTDAFFNKERTILKHLKLKQKYTDATGEVLFFNLDEARFWDVNQINWGNDTPPFLIGDSEIKADNVTLDQLNYQLANILELPIVTSDSALAQEPHDWDVHYKYYELMTSSLNDAYGIQAKKIVGKYPKYIITKKAP